MPTKPKLLMGVDGGSTKTLIRLVDASGKIIGESHGGSGNVRTSPRQAWLSVLSAVKNIMPESELKKYDVHMVLGLAGMEVKSRKALFLRLKPDFIKTADVYTDAHIACVGAHHGKNGGIIIAGTGVHGYQIEDGSITDVGGWGFPMGDEGGGSWIGLQAVRVALKTCDGIYEPSLLSKLILEKFNDSPDEIIELLAISDSSTEFGTFTYFVTEAAEQGDKMAQNILKEAARHISDIGAALYKKQRSGGEPLPVALLGGMERFLEPYLDEALKKRLAPRLADTVVGAILIAAAEYAPNVQEMLNTEM